MSSVVRAQGRRERNKQLKLDRITAAARELFEQYGVDEVTTQEIADRADVATGTLFLYATTKAELLLLVHNVKYAEALEAGEAAANVITDVVDAVMAVIRPIVTCNRAQIENGRTYLKEIVFGGQNERYHREALALTNRTEQLFAKILRRQGSIDSVEMNTLARIVSAIMFLSMTPSYTVTLTDAEIIMDVRGQVELLLAPGTRSESVGR